MPQAPSCTIDFNKYYSALETVNLMNCQGYVVRVSGSTVESAGPVVGLGELCGIHVRDGRRILAEVVGFRHDHLILLPLEHIEGVSPGDAVTARTTPRHIMLSERTLGRVLNGLGEPIDDKGPLPGGEKCPLDVSSPPPLSREKITKPLALGIRSIDGVLTCARGQRVGIFAGSGVGKSVLLGDIAVSSDAAVNVVALIGERGREVREFLEENLGPEGLARSVVVVATSDAPPIQRVKAAFVAVTIAEYFREKWERSVHDGFPDAFRPGAAGDRTGRGRAARHEGLLSQRLCPDAPPDRAARLLAERDHHGHSHRARGERRSDGPGRGQRPQPAGRAHRPVAKARGSRPLPAVDSCGASAGSCPRW